MVTLVTSLNEKIFREYGERMISSFSKMSQDVRLIVVFEGQIPNEIVRSQNLISIVELKSDEFERFRLFFGNLYEAHGLKIAREKQANGEIVLKPKWDYRFDLIRFAFKIFSIDIARKIIPAQEYFAWIDADVVCLKPFYGVDLLSLFPDNSQIMSYLGRTNFPPNNPYSECGFLGFNPKSEMLGAFLDRMKALYTTGEAFRFREWHDSWLWDEVRKEFQAQGFSFKNLSGQFEHVEHPFINSPLGNFFDHLKGPRRKLAGKSFDEDYKKS